VQSNPYLTADLPGVGGRIKVHDADFRVDEIPLYPPSGYGEHTYARIEKTGISTFEAAHRVARALGVDPRTVGYAGLKDAHAVTVQTLSLGDVSPAEVERLDVPGVRVLAVDRHTNKLKVGHLRGNRFTIRVRDTACLLDAGCIVEEAGVRDTELEPGISSGVASETVLSAAQAILDVLIRHGVPNYFGEQRFGFRGDTHLLGLALVRQDPDAFIRRFVGMPHPAETPRVREARTLFEQGDLQASWQAWPRHMEAERRVLRTLLDRPDDPRRAIRALPNRLRKFYVSAYQSALFNEVLALRLAGAGPDSGSTVERHAVLGCLMLGDLAWIHGKGAVFVVDDPDSERARADRIEISPSGPLYGYKVTLAQGVPGEVEQCVLAEQGLELDDWRLRGLKLKGARRPLRFPLREVALSYDKGLLLSFVLPPGCYATAVLREIIK
jgi:tRNA pseudouridine13 synthase